MQLILGAGCAGLSLACALVDAGVDEQIVLVDRRTSFENDRTWCFWATGSEPAFTSQATHSWPAWRLVGRDGRVAEHRSPRTPYLQLPADRLYAEALARLEAAPNVELRLGERVLRVEEQADRVRVETAGGALDAAVAFDAMGGAGPLNAGREDGGIELRQRFVGLEVETERPVFDPGVATLMDFRAGSRDDDALRFMYVLPTSPTRALLEDTSLGGGAVPARTRRHAIARHLEEVWGAGEVTVLREERGALPMSTHAFPASRGPRLHAVGAAAGAVRPSSGYAFVRLQRHVQAVARAVALGQAPPAELGARRHRVLDQLFLRALASDPAGFDEHLLALARGTDGARFARFMNDESGRLDEAAVVAAMTRPSYLKAMVSRPAPVARPAVQEPACGPARAARPLASPRGRRPRAVRV